jgi:ABC-type bacteriocin/lantibiotic exporter with double-glycine peptidase domain
MKNLTLFKVFGQLKHHRRYIFYAIAYGLSTLILPLGVQYLVNNLALSGIWLNTLTFVVLIALGLIFTQICRHSQVILLEYFQREIFLLEIAIWKNFNRKGKEHYFFEVVNLLKSFAKSYSNLIEMALVVVFGLFTIIIFHPIFILLPIAIGTVLYQIFLNSLPPIKASIQESYKKYDLYYQLINTGTMSDVAVDDFLEARDHHFLFIRKNSFKISLLTIICHIFLLGTGIYLIQRNQLSVGQLVSAEIIISGIFNSLVKLPQTLESIYDYETGQYKILKGVQTGEHHD